MWDSSVTDGGDLSVTPGAASVGNFGMQADIDDATPIYVVDLTPACEKRYRARFYFDPNSVVIADLDYCTLFTAYQNVAVELIKIDLRYSNGSYQVRCYTLHDSWHQSDNIKSWRTTAWYPISDSLHYFEFDWQAATAMGLDSGNLTFLIDGLLRINITDIDNDTRCVDWIALGITGGLDPGTIGVCFFDDFVSRRTTYIGPEPGVLGSPSPSLSPSMSYSQSSSPSLSPSPSPSPAVIDLIFEDDFETGNLAAWSSSVTDGGDLSVTAPAAMFGVFGMQALIDDTTPIYVTDIIPVAEERYRARFYFDPNSIVMADLDCFTIMIAYSGVSTEIIKIDLRYSNGNYQIRIYTLCDSWFMSDDAGSWITTAWYTISNSSHCIEFDWESSFASGLNNGHLSLWIDGILKISITDLDNDTRGVDFMRLGAVSGIDTTTLGTCYFDEFISRRITYIGA